MKLILLGAPGAGKGTQAVRIAEKYAIPHISTGDIFRYNIKNQTELGRKAKEYMDKGELVPDELTCKIVADRIVKEDCANGFLLDGFPRNLFQAEALSEMTDIDAVINIDVDLAKLMARLTGRRVCGKCGESYHIDFLNGKTDCAKCGAELIQRADDCEATVKSRLDVYVSQTQPLIDYYGGKGLIRNVDGSQPIEDVFADVCKILG